MSAPLERANQAATQAAPDWLRTMSSWIHNLIAAERKPPGSRSGDAGSAGQWIVTIPSAHSEAIYLLTFKYPMKLRETYLLMYCHLTPMSKLLRFLEKKKRHLTSTMPSQMEPKKILRNLTDKACLKRCKN